MTARPVTTIPDKLRDRLAAMPPEDRAAVEEFAIKAIEQTPFFQTESGRTRAWELALTMKPWELALAANGLVPPAASDPVPPAARPDSGGGEPRGAPQATRLAKLGREAELFRTPNGDPFASFTVNEHRETERIRSAAFRGWLGGRYHEDTGKTPGAQAMRDATDELLGQACYGGSISDVHVRVAHRDGAIYLDLADSERRVVEVTAAGWRITSEVPVRFVRPKALLPLPVPQPDGSLDDLLRIMNLGAPEDLVLVQAFLLSLFQREGSYPVLVVYGEQGSAKSSLARMLKRTVDPSGAPLRAEPREIRDLMIGARNSMVLAFDNLSHIPPWLSDAFCRLSSGAGISTRELYSDSEETILEAKRPVILTGIEEIATRPDLLDRCLLLSLPAIPDERRRVESEVLSDFEAAHPRVLGALLDAVSVGLRNLAGARPTRLSRLADFDRWVSACAPSLGLSPEAFQLAYSANRAGANSLALDSSPVAAGLLRLVEMGAFHGTMGELLDALEKIESPDTLRQRFWPKTPRALRGLMGRLASNLRAAGVAMTFLPRTASSRPVRLERVDPRDAGLGSLMNRQPDGHGSTPSATTADVEPDGNDGLAGPLSEEGAV